MVNEVILQLGNQYSIKLTVCHFERDESVSDHKKQKTKNKKTLHLKGNYI